MATTEQCVIKLTGPVSYRDAIALNGKIEHALRVCKCVVIDLADAVPVDPAGRGFMVFLASMGGERIRVRKAEAFACATPTEELKGQGFSRAASMHDAVAN